ncbi:MAG: hypothetical protein N3H84_08050, partial [Candidatus Caldarchaeum sp.]|nr:hypothetical protein [Candidatus Caldarchaeum sp.]
QLSSASRHRAENRVPMGRNPLNLRESWSRASRRCRLLSLERPVNGNSTTANDWRNVFAIDVP